MLILYIEDGDSTPLMFTAAAGECRGIGAPVHCINIPVMISPLLSSLRPPGSITYLLPGLPWLAGLWAGLE